MRLRVPLALFTGVLIGLAVGGPLRAQKQPAAFYVAEVAVNDTEADKRVLARFPSPAEAFGGRYLSRGGKSLTFIGEPPKRLILVAFDTLDAVRLWRDAPQTRQFEDERKAVGSTILRAFAVEGLPQ